MLIDSTSLDFWDALTYLGRLILPQIPETGFLGLSRGGSMISLVRGKRPEAPTVL